VKRSEQLFVEVRCAVCHVPELKTGPKAPLPALADQIIHPYTDLIAARYGEGWRTTVPIFRLAVATGAAPLWGLGLSQSRGNANLLHDGHFPRNVTGDSLARWRRAISRDAFRSLPASDRAKRCCRFFNRSRAARSIRAGALRQCGCTSAIRQALP
jgi:CxxC motif-containing protein (DUF1111 family)